VEGAKPIGGIMQSIIDQFQRVLGRAPRPDEISYFTKFINEETLSPYEIGQVLQSTPEYQSTMLKKQGQGQFRRLGRPDSSGYAGAFAGAAKDLAASRQASLAQFYGGGLQTAQANVYGQGMGAIGRGNQLTDRRQQRAWDLEDYYRQKEDYLGAMKAQSGLNLKSQLIGGGIGILGGAASGYAGGLGLASGLKSLGGAATNFQGYMPERGF
jgi:hypothetical protein